MSGGYDQEQYLEAARIGRAHPAWLVLWGTYSRHFWAYPTFAAPPGTIITAPTPGDLVVLMRQTEITAAAQRPPPRQR